MAASVNSILALLLHFLLSTIFSIYIRGRKLYHALFDRISAILNYHHRTPEIIARDVKPLARLPKHLSVILTLPPDQKDVTLLLNRLDGLIHDACELVAWSAAAGIPVLSIYEKTGLLKSSQTHLHRRIEKTLTSYYGATNPHKPTFSLRAPNTQSYTPPASPPSNHSSPPHPRQRPHITLLLLSAADSRQTLVDLTRTLASMSQSHTLSPSDISPALIDAELEESVMGEPDLLIMFGEKATLEGYPPWQVRLTEIFQLADYTGGVGYHVFVRGLRKYAGAEMRFGR
ncbi:hypothetical protein LTR95_013210 [Oleoguttula sp. CCFEE 5521]|uniref:ditrans,polycis-polyprenyl diphosphate synthase [(2E,6E)-farnesyldiphosphate specific] n=1 Tax=Cryoendolithus antarcticus TaxID=1507870 RepID=A0A1V8SYK2_9PEZI|nr:hypothetical protein B0A48_10844 [Cryoendolithus antarcticus]